MRPKLVINARFLSQHVTGVQRFAENISLELRKLLPDAIFVCPPNILRPGVSATLGSVPVGNRAGHLWEQVELPAYLASIGSPLLVNLGNTGPILYGNQISTHHDIAYIRHPGSFSFPFRSAYRALTPFLLRRSKALITVSEFSRREICGYYRFPMDRVVVVPNAAGAEFVATRRRPASPPYLLAVSSPNRHKNFSRVIEAYSTWSKSSQVELRIVGSQSSAFSSQHFDSIPSGIRFLGRVSDDELIELYSGALGFLFPSTYEGFGIPPLEAQAVGCPVIASNAAAIPETLGESALYFDPYDVGAIQAAMDSLVSSEELRASLIAKGRSNVARYSWAASAERVADLVRVHQ